MQTIGGVSWSSRTCIGTTYGSSICWMAKYGNVFINFFLAKKRLLRFGMKRFESRMELCFYNYLAGYVPLFSGPFTYVGFDSAYAFWALGGSREIVVIGRYVSTHCTS